MTSISDQALDLSWRDAWRHEERNTHGEWTHGASLPGVGGNISHGFKGRFTGQDVERPSMTPAAGHEALDRPGRPEGVAQGTAEDPIDVRGDLKRAVELMAAGEHVRLNSPSELPGLMDEINRQGDAQGAGVGHNLPWDLGMISVKGTRLFNEQTIGTPRQDMPQLNGPARPGSEAAILAGGANRFIELDPEFKAKLHKDGIEVRDERVPVSELRATQTQITATAVAGIYRAARAGNPKVLHMLREPLWASRDNYVLDGHHRWAADTVLRIANGHWPGGQVEVQRIDLPAKEAVPYTVAWTSAMGIGAQKLGGWSQLVVTSNISDQVLDLSWRDAWIHEMRGPHGEWVSGGGRPPELLKSIPQDLGSSDYKNAIKAKTAANVKRGDWIAWADTVPDPTGFGLATAFRPIQVISARHFSRGRGDKRRAFVTFTYNDGNSETLRAGSHIDTIDPNRLPGHAPPPPPRPRAASPPPPAAPPPVVTPEAITHDNGQVTASIQGGYDKDQVVKALGEIQHGLDLQSQWVPGAAKRQVITMMYDLSDGSPRAEAETTQDEKIEIKPLVTEAYSGEKAKIELMRSVNDGWWTPSDMQYSLADVTVAHEVGHRLADDLPTKDFPGLWAGLAKTMGIPPPETIKDVFGGRPLPDPKSWVVSHRAVIRDKVSEYGSTNQQELEAELWREYTMSAHPRPPAKFYGDYLLEHLPKKDK